MKQTRGDTRQNQSTRTRSHGMTWQENTRLQQPFSRDKTQRNPNSGKCSLLQCVSKNMTLCVMLSLTLILAMLAPVVTEERSILHHTLLRREREEVAHQWAPLVWLHPNEYFYPSSVYEFLQHTKPSTSGNHDPRSNGMSSNESTIQLPPLPRGKLSHDYYLLAPHNFDCVNCPLPKFIFGKKPSRQYSPPVYAAIHPCPQPSYMRGGRSIHSFPHQNLFNDEAEVVKQGTQQLVHDSPEPRSTTPTDEVKIPSTVNKQLSQPPSHPSVSTRITPQSEDHHQLSSPSTEEHMITLVSSSSSPTIIPSTSVMPSTDTASLNVHSDQLERQEPSKINSTSNKTTLSTGNTNSAVTDPSLGAGNNYTAAEIHQMTPQVTTEKFSLQLRTTIATTLPTLLPNSFNNYSMGTEWNSTNLYSNQSNTIHYLTQEMTFQNSQNESTSTSRTTNTHHTTKKRHTQSSAPLNDQSLPFIKQRPETENTPPQAQEFSVTYWMFYPYNHGKSICTANLGYFLGRMFKPRINGVCHGEEVTMGNHVGDWEHVSIQFKGKRPTQMYVSTHTFGAYYVYDPQDHEFRYTGSDTREGIPLSPKYPQVVHLSGSNPILYAAKGSHGLWAAPGVHQYNSFPSLKDETGKGTPWKTWLNLDITDLNDPMRMPRQQRQWWSYEGRWGNPSHRCHPLMVSFCEVVSGPTGIPRKRINFRCSQN